MTTAFQTKSLQSQSLMQRLLGQLPADNAVIEVNNLLASRPIQTITAQELGEIEHRYRFTLDRYQLNLEEFYAVHLNYCLADRELTDEEQAELTHLRGLFRLSASFIDMVHGHIGEVIYRKRVKQAVQNAVFTTAEKASLQRLQQMLALPTPLAETIYLDVCQAHIAQLVNQVGSNSRLNPNEVDRLQQSIRQLGVEPTSETKMTIDRFRRYWTIEQDELPVLSVTIPLQRGEICHCKVTHVSWYEERATARRSSSDDHFEYNQAYDVLNLQSNHGSTQKDRFPLLKRMDIGTVYVTNKRLLFQGSDKTSTIKLPAIREVKAYSQGMLIDKTTGKDMLLLIKRDSDSIALLLQRLREINPLQ